MSEPIPVAPDTPPGPGATRRTKTGSRLWDLYVGELNPLVTNKANFYLLFAVTAILGIVAMAFFYNDIEGYFAFAYAILPSFTTVFAATTYTRDRQSGFASVVQTVPVSRAEYFAAKFLSTMTLGFIFLVLTVPFTGLAFYFAGGYLWNTFGNFLIISIPLMMASTALGLFVSVVMGKRGLLASSITGFGVSVLFAGAGVFLMEVGRSLANAPEGTPFLEVFRTISNLSHLAPIVNVIDFTSAYPDNMTLAWKTLFTVLWLAAALSGGAWALYNYLQNVEDWDAPKWATTGGVVGVLVVASLPVFVIDYYEGPPENPYGYYDDYNRRTLHVNSQFIPAVGEKVPYSPVCALPPGFFDGSHGGDGMYRDPYGDMYQLAVGESRDYQMCLSFSHQGADNATFHNVRIRFEEAYNPNGADVRLTPITMPEGATFEAPDTIVFPQVRLLGQNAIVYDDSSHKGAPSSGGRFMEHGATVEDANRPGMRVYHFNVTLKAASSSSLGYSYAQLGLNVTYNNGTSYSTYGGSAISVYQPAYRWYYPLYILAGLAVVEVAPFVYRSRKVGKRGM